MVSALAAGLAQGASAGACWQRVETLPGHNLDLNPARTAPGRRRPAAHRSGSARSVGPWARPGPGPCAPRESELRSLLMRLAPRGCAVPSGTGPLSRTCSGRPTCGHCATTSRLTRASFSPRSSAIASAWAARGRSRYWSSSIGIGYLWRVGDAHHLRSEPQVPVVLKGQACQPSSSSIICWRSLYRHGGEASPVGRPGFKPGRGRQPLLGGFDSHSLPPPRGVCVGCTFRRYCQVSTLAIITHVNF